MPVLKNISSLAQCLSQGPQSEIHLLSDAALVWEAEQILWVGQQRELPDEYSSLPVVDAEQCLVLPGLVECHTHLAFGGWRESEFKLRCSGATYQEIAASGGGILSSVKTTRAASEQELIEHCLENLKQMAALGITCVEAKSGYALNKEDELKVLRVYRELNNLQPLEIVPTYLGAHVMAPEFRDNRQGYIDLITKEILPQVAEQNLAEFCDIFVEEGAYSNDEAREVLTAAKDLGLDLKLHVDQLTDGGGAELAAELSAVSADHLEYVSDRGIEAMAEANVTAVSLPLATLYLRQKPLDARRLINAGVKVAVSTDFNPGSAPSYHLPMAMTLACTMNYLTPNEAIKAATIYAAAAINRASELGSLEVGKRADFILLDSPNFDHWLYHLKANAVKSTYVRGGLVTRK